MRVIDDPRLQPGVQAPGAGGLHLADDAVQALDLGVGAAEVGRLVVDGGAELASSS